METIYHGSYTQNTEDNIFLFAWIQISIDNPNV